MQVIKRNGEKSDLDISQIRKQTIPACSGLKHVDYTELEISLGILLRDNITTKEIQNNLIQSAVNKIDIAHPDYTFVAARLSLYDLYHNIKRYYNVSGSGDVYKKVTLGVYLNKMVELDQLSGFYAKYTEEEINELDNYIDAKNDLLLTYLAVDTLKGRYLLKDKDSVIVELPQHLHMRLAMFLAQDEIDKLNWAKVFYRELSELNFINATPVNSNGGRKNGSTISCLIATVGDSLDSIMDVAKEVSIGSKLGSGWGIDWSRVRAQGGAIAGRRGVAGGKIPFLKIYNDIAVAVDQLMVRPGAFAVNIEVWDLEIFDFINMSKKNTDERRKAADLFTAVSVNDLFMRREESGGTYTLFDPYDVRDLTELYGEEFEAAYIKHEIEFSKHPEKYNPNTRTIPAVDIMRALVISYNQEGSPWWFFKDTVNTANQHKELGIIRSSNLCMEILQPTDDEHTAVCNLGSINLAKINTTEDLKRVTRVAMRIMDNSIDLTSYPSEKAKRTQLERRSTGLGMLGEAEYLANNKITYGSDEHIEVIDAIYETVANEAYAYSQELAKEKGSCIIDGIRNAYRLAVAPNVTSSLLAGTTSSGEAVFDKEWIEENMLGSFAVTAPNINPDNYPYYIGAYDVDQFKLIDVTAVKTKHVDMGISMSMFLRPEGLKAKTIRDLLRHAWKKKVKTVYYLRSKPPAKNTIKTTDMKCIGCDN